jgi:hypothetical protein
MGKLGTDHGFSRKTGEWGNKLENWGQTTAKTGDRPRFLYARFFFAEFFLKLLKPI